MAQVLDWIAPHRLYLDATGRVVGAKDPARETLLVQEGGRLPYYQAEQLGLVEARTTQPLEPKPVVSEVRRRGKRRRPYQVK